jgi:hypothetical protein
MPLGSTRNCCRGSSLSYRARRRSTSNVGTVRVRPLMPRTAQHRVRQRNELRWRAANPPVRCSGSRAGSLLAGPFRTRNNLGATMQNNSTAAVSFGLGVAATSSKRILTCAGSMRARRPYLQHRQLAELIQAWAGPVLGDELTAAMQCSGAFGLPSDVSFSAA